MKLLLLIFFLFLRMCNTEAHEPPKSQQSEIIIGNEVVVGSRRNQYSVPMDKNKVVVYFTVDRQGATKNIQSQGAPSQEIAEDITNVVRNMKFNPATRGGRPVEQRMRMVIDLEKSEYNLKYQKEEDWC